MEFCSTIRKVDVICKFWAVRECVKADNYPYRHSWDNDNFNTLASVQRSHKVVPQRKLVIYPVIWNPPPFNWIKINTDGAACGSPGNASCGGVFRDSTGSILGAFSSFIGRKTVLEAEMYGVIHAIKIACNQGWHRIWLENDSQLALTMVKNFKSYVPTTIKEDWSQTLATIQKMEVLISHIYREGNEAADKLAKYGLHSRDHFTWFSGAPEFIIPDSLLDALDHVRYRVKKWCFVLFAF